METLPKPDFKSRRHKELKFRKSHAFVIGIDEYRGLDANLKTAVKDSKDIAMRLKVLQGFDNVLLLNNVSKKQILALFDWLTPKKEKRRSTSLRIPDRTFRYGDYQYKSSIAWLKLPEEIKKKKGLPKYTFIWEKQGKDGGEREETLYLQKKSEIDIEPEDSIVFYYAGHGFPGEIKEGPAGYLTPTDATNEMVKNESLISMDKLYQVLSKLGCKHTLLLLDCCFAGKFRFSSLSRGRPKPFIIPLYEKRFERYKTHPAWQVLVSAGPEQTANDSAKWADIRDNSPFAATLKEAMEGKADLHTLSNRTQGDGIITATELFLYIWNQVEEITSEFKPQHPGLFPMEQHREGEFIFLNPNIAQGQFKFAEDPDKNPYKGLVPYEPEDANLFFGRDKALASLLQKIPFREIEEELSGSAVIFLTAPSAAGKSSLAKAGLFPFLEKKYGYEDLFIFRPAPLGQIKGIHISPNRKKEENNIIGAYEREEWKGLWALESRLDAGKNQMIIIDQFEEFFTEIESKEKQNAFENALLSIIESQEARREQPLVFLFTMRSDVEWQMSKTRLGGNREEDKLKFWKKEHIFRLQPMDLDELRESLTGPAWWALYDFKNKPDGDHRDDGEELINQILKDVMYYPAALPLLSCVMQAFYEKARKNGESTSARRQKLIREDYDGKDGLGGVEGALSANAEAFYQQLKDQRTKDLMQKILMRMISFGDAGYIRRKVTYNEPLEWFDTSSETTDTVEAGQWEKNMWERVSVENDQWGEKSILYELDFGKEYEYPLKVLINKMEAAFLLVQDKNHEGLPIVEPAHDALINHWPRCLEWIEIFGKDNLLLQRQLWKAVLDNRRPPEVKLTTLSYEVTSEDDLVIDKDITDDFSEFWDTNPKLMQVLEHISNKAGILFQKDFDLNQLFPGMPSTSIKAFEKFWHDCQSKGKIPDLNSLILSGFSDRLLSLMLEEGDHWLNQEEVEFISRSWEERIKDIIALKKQRDQAQANDMASKALIALSNHDRSTAFRLAELAHKYIDKDNPEVIRVLSDTLYYNGDPNRIAADYLRWCRNLIGHTNWVTAIACSPATPEDPDGGRFLLTGSTDGTARIWDIKSGIMILLLEGHKNYIWDVAYSPKGDRVVTASTDKTAIVWDAVKGSPLLTLKGHKDHVTSVAFSPKGDRIITGSNDKTAKVWDAIKEGSPLLTLEGHGAGVWSVAYAPNSKHLLTGSRDKTAKVWNANKAGKAIFTLEGHKNDIWSVAYSPKGDQILTGSKDGTAKTWNAAKGGVALLTLDGHKGPIRSVAFSPKNKKEVLTTSDDQTAIVWNLSTREIKYRLEAHTGPLRSGVYLPNGQHIITGSEDKTAKIWGIDPDIGPPALLNYSSSIKSIDFSPKGDYILTRTQNKKILAWNAGSLYQRTPLAGLNDEIEAKEISPWQKQFLFNLEEGEPVIFNMRVEDPPAFIRLGHKGHITSLACSPDGEQLLSGSTDKTAKVWDIKNNKDPVFTLKGHNDIINQVVYSPEGKLIFTASDDNTAKVWDAFNGGHLLSLEGHLGSVFSVACSPDGKRILTGSKDKTAKVWDAETGRLMLTLKGHKGYIYSVAFTPDGEHMLTGSRDRTVRLWKTTGDGLISQRSQEISALTPAQILEYNIVQALENTAGAWEAFLNQEDPLQLWAFGIFYRELAGSGNNPVIFNQRFGKAISCFLRSGKAESDAIYLNEIANTYTQWGRKLFELNDFANATKKATLALGKNSQHQGALKLMKESNNWF